MKVTPVAAIQAADAEKKNGRDRGAASELHVKSRIFVGVSSFNHPVHRIVEIALAQTPLRSRAPWHGFCAEVSCLSQSFDAQVDPDGGTMLTVNIGNSGNGRGHGTLKKSCISCVFLLKDFGVNYV